MMKNLYKAWAILACIMGLSSCLHDNDEVFDKSAAERIAEAVSQDKELLESASNGWQLTLATGSGYSGGTYNLFLKFKNGKVTAQGDIAPADMKSTSSYDVIKDKGPVLTFNTYNPIIHFMAEPSYNALSGREGDYEFVITRTTQDTIYLRGKKYGNDMRMTRVAEDTDISNSIKRIQLMRQSICGWFSNGNKIYIIDPSTQTFYVVRNGVATNSMTIAYSTEGFYLPTAETEGFKEDSFKWDAEKQELTSITGTSYQRIQMDGYMTQQEWKGKWNLRYIGSNSSYENFQINLVDAEDLIEQPAMGGFTGQFVIDGITFELIVYYSPITGLISIPAQYIEDPTGTYPLFFLLGCDAYSDELGWYAITWNFSYDTEAGQYIIDPANEGTNGKIMNTIQMLVVSSSGSIMTNEEGMPMTLVSLAFPDVFSRVEE